MNDDIKANADKYIRSVISSLGQADEEFMSNDEVSTEYGILIDSIIRHPECPDAMYNISSYILWFSERTRSGEVTPESALDEFANKLLGAIKWYNEQLWYGIFPLERLFSGFPEKTDLEIVQIINKSHDGNIVVAMDGNIADNTTAITLKESLVANLDIAEYYSSDEDINETTLDMQYYLDHFSRKNGGYLLGRPLAVLAMGSGGDHELSFRFRAESIRVLQRLKFCQIVYHDKLTMLENVTHRIQYAPDGTVMSYGLSRIPALAIGVHQNSGTCTQWEVGCEQYETSDGKPYDCERFVSIWKEYILPIERLRARTHKKIIDSLENAIGMISRCRHREMGDFTLHVVIALETILNPFRCQRNIARRFRTFSSVLASDNVDEQSSLCEVANYLYKYRCGAVHSSVFHSIKCELSDGRQALELFRRTYKGLLKWLEASQENNETITKRGFQIFYLNSTKHLGDIPSTACDVTDCS